MDENGPDMESWLPNVQFPTQTGWDVVRKYVRGKFCHLIWYLSDSCKCFNMCHRRQAFI